MFRVPAYAKRFLALLLFLALPLESQLTTGAINGSVVDPSGQLVPEATVTLLNERTREARSAVTNASGDFTFPAVGPGLYTIKVERTGFRTFQRTGINLTANERLSVGSLELSLGTVAETVSVKAEGAPVQTSSSENSELLSTNQLNLLLTRGRDVVSLLRVLPGITYQASESESLGGTFGTISPNIGGTRNRWNTFSLDGQTGSDADLVEYFNGSTSMDAVEEVKVLMNNYQAEYGRNAGAFVNIISKSGTRDFHGSLYWFKRHEQFNANDFFNNRNNQAKPLYRYNTFGGTLGGPIYIPKVFNRNRDKLFFFYSREDWRVFEPRVTRRVTMPTQLEREGDFSQTRDLNNALIPIIDPLTRQPFPGNIIPANRVNRNGQAILRLFPAPNVLDRALSAGNYNYQFQEITELPKKQNLLKVDWNITDNDRFTMRGRTWWSDRRGYEGLAAFNSNWNQLFHHYLFTEDTIQGTYTKIFSPSVVNEFSMGFRELGELGDLTSPTDFDPVIRSKVGLAGLSQMNPEGNPLNIIPQASFGGVPSAANIMYDPRTPIDAGDERFTYVDNFSITRANHSIKLGLYVERNRISEGPRSNFGGNFNFGRDPNNPFDSNYAFSNAILGNFLSYTESSRRTIGPGKNYLFEWFAQDTWKVTRKLTVDYGMRFALFSPWRLRNDEGAVFALERYDPAKAPLLFRPVRDASGTRFAQNPVTGALLPEVYIGAYVPGTGDPINGMVTASDPSYPDGFRERQPIQLQPRVGFAYDLTGDGKTAIRGGFGITKQTIPSSQSFFWSVPGNAPIQFNPVIFYGNLDTFLDTTGVLFPGDTTGFEKEYNTPSVWNYSLSVQRNIGFNTVIDIGYVGNVARHLQQNRNLNTIPYGARFNPQNFDPTNPGRPLPDNFFRPFPGYGAVNYVENSGISNYNSLQISANRRFSQGLQFGVAYTWSKAMDLTSGDGGGLPIYRPYDIWTYGKSSFDQTHVFVFNYTWDVPKASKVWPNPVVKAALDNWQLSGITSFVSGSPLGIGFSTTDNADIVGGGDGVRVNVTGKAQLPHGERRFERWFDPTVFARPASGDFGNAPKDIFRGPGVNNWDLSLFKNFPLWSETRYLQFRWEAYNIFNHTQFASVDTNARFDPAGNQVNGQFGQVTSTRNPRVMQLSLSFKF